MLLDRVSYKLKQRVERPFLMISAAGVELVWESTCSQALKFNANTAFVFNSPIPAKEALRRSTGKLPLFTNTVWL